MLKKNFIKALLFLGIGNLNIIALDTVKPTSAEDTPQKSNMLKPKSTSSKKGTKQSKTTSHTEIDKFCTGAGTPYNLPAYKIFRDSFCMNENGKHFLNKKMAQKAIEQGGVMDPATKELVNVPVKVRGLLFLDDPKLANIKGNPKKNTPSLDPAHHPTNAPGHKPKQHTDTQHSHKGTLILNNTGVHDDIQKTLNIEIAFKILEGNTLKHIHPVSMLKVPPKGTQPHQNYIPQNVLAELHKSPHNKLVVSASTMVNAKCVEAQNLQIHPDDVIEFAIHGGKNHDEPIALVFSINSCGSCETESPPLHPTDPHHPGHVGPQPVEPGEKKK